MNATGAIGNAATRIETYVLSGGTYAYGGHADIDDLFRQQTGERDLEPLQPNASRSG